MVYVLPSCRTIFMTAALREELKQWLERLKREETLDPERYRNSGMLLRLPNGLAVEPVLIRKKFLKWQDAHPEFPPHRLSRSAAFQCHLPVDDLRRRHQGGAGDHRTRQCGYAGEHLRPYPAVLPCRAGQEVRKWLLRQARHLQPAGCTRRRRTHHLHDGSFGIAQGCRPGNEGKAPHGTAHLMQKRALIAMQYSALHHRTWITPTVQKPCRNRAPMAYK